MSDEASRWATSNEAYVLLDEDGVILAANMAASRIMRRPIPVGADLATALGGEAAAMQADEIRKWLIDGGRLRLTVGDHDDVDLDLERQTVAAVVRVRRPNVAPSGLEARLRALI